MNSPLTQLPLRRWLLLIGIGLAVTFTAARWIGSPGYMDADYYYATGIQLQAGQGFQEPFLWNYLDEPTELPHPSHLYWMPATSLLAAAGLSLFGPGFGAAQLPFVLAASSLPPLVATLALNLTRDANQAWKAGLLAAFPGFFLPFLVTTDAFGIYAIVGGLALWMIGRAIQTADWKAWMGTGALIGIANLIRADAALLLLAAVLMILIGKPRRPAGIGALAAGFAIVLAPWWLRNLSQTGAMLNPGSGRLLWMLEYDELFSFPADQLTFERWWRGGLNAAIGVRLNALWVNLQRLVAENGLIFLTPFMVIGAYRSKEHPAVRATWIYLGLLYLAMSLIFPFVGQRGALFHSSAAALPMLWALVPVGLDSGIDWLGARRGWNLTQAKRVFGGSAIVLAVLITVGLFVGRQVQTGAMGAGWDTGAEAYARVAAILPAAESGIVAVNNPPGFFVYGGQSSVVIPNGDSDVLRSVVRQFGVRWIVLEANHPAGLEALYAKPESVPWLVLIDSLIDHNGLPILVFEVTSS